MTELLPPALQPYGPLIIGAATAILIFAVGWIAAKWVHAICLRLLRRAQVDEALARFLAAIAQYAVLAVAVIAALTKVGVQTTSLVALVGAAGLAIGLALQGNLSNFAAGVLILLFRPFTLDDLITVGGKTGTVKEVGLFATTMVTPANETIIVPNAKITSDAIVNFTARGTRRGAIAIGIAYGSDVERAIGVMIAACNSVDTVIEEPAPSVYFTGFGASSLDFEVRPWAAIGDFAATVHKVRLALYAALEEAGIEIPFDQIVVHRQEASS